MRPAEHVLERAAGYGERLDRAAGRSSRPRARALPRPVERHPARGEQALHDGLRGQRAAVDRAAVPLPRDPARRPRAHQNARGALPRRRRRDHRAVARSRRTASAASTSPTARTSPRRPRSPRTRRYLLYFGALQPWQGVDTALRAFSRLKDLEDLELVICSSTHPRRAKPYRKLAEKLEIEPRWHFQLSEPELAPWREHATLSLAPLRDCARNAQQGCAPLKILESHASGTPVVASDLPATRELIDASTGRLVAPDRPGELARAIRVLLDYPERIAELGRNAAPASTRGTRASPSSKPCTLPTGWQWRRWRERREVGVQGADPRTAGDRGAAAHRGRAQPRRVARAARRRSPSSTGSRTPPGRAAAASGRAATRARRTSRTGCATSRSRCCRSCARTRTRRRRSRSRSTSRVPSSARRSCARRARTRRAATTRSSTPSTTTRGSRARRTSSTAPTCTSR